MFLTGTFKKTPPQGTGEGESLGPLTDEVAKLLIKSKKKLAEYENQIAAAEAELAGYEKQSAEAGTKVADYESRLAAVTKGLIDYEGRLAVTDGKLANIKTKLANIKTETGSLSSAEAPTSKIQDLVKLYGSMKPNGAAAILCKLEADLSMRILTQMNSRASGKLMDAIATTNPDYAAKISKLMAQADTPGSYPKPMNN